ncbi:hypothetical protein BH09BAC3_BH09BAC3_10910 [soil metagenome]
MADDTTAPDSKSNKGCYLFIGKIVAFMVAVYVLQWILQLIFKAPDSDKIAAALEPFQNHYLSFSKYYLTTEGSVGEFTDDMTGAGRFLSYSIFGGILWFVLVVIFSLIKALKKSFDLIFWFITIAITGVVFYWAFFVPYRKTVFTDTEVIIQRTENIFFTKKIQMPFKSVERFEYDFHEDQDIHTGHQLYSQIFAVVGGVRILLGENQISIETSDASPTKLQEKAAQQAVQALTKLINPVL